jgi:hypothetical protein
LNFNHLMGNESDSDGDDRPRGGSGGGKDGSSGGKGGSGDGYDGGSDPPDQHFHYHVVGGGTEIGTIHNYQYTYD